MKNISYYFDRYINLTSKEMHKVVKHRHTDMNDMNGIKKVTLEVFKGDKMVIKATHCSTQSFQQLEEICHEIIMLEAVKKLLE